VGIPLGKCTLGRRRKRWNGIKMDHNDMAVRMGCEWKWLEIVYIGWLPHSSLFQILNAVLSRSCAVAGVARARGVYYLLPAYWNSWITNSEAGSCESKWTSHKWNDREMLTATSQASSLPQQKFLTARETRTESRLLHWSAPFATIPASLLERF
jgi:hypothetical protein